MPEWRSLRVAVRPDDRSPQTRRVRAATSRSDRPVSDSDVDPARSAPHGTTRGTWPGLPRLGQPARPRRATPATTR